LLTGANKGDGFEIARGLAERGFTALIGARNAVAQHFVKADHGTTARGRTRPIPGHLAACLQ
jgi:NAD(P)-dependent dehydrogenase (short-subunit alcohol dehydrogenase family)